MQWRWAKYRPIFSTNFPQCLHLKLLWDGKQWSLRGMRILRVLQILIKRGPVVSSYSILLFFFLILNQAMILQDVQLVLAKEEAAQAVLRRLPHHKTSLSSFLMTGFELEDSQCIEFSFIYLDTSQYFHRYLLCREASQTKGLRTSKKLANLQEKQNALHCLIQNWHEVQLVYTPHVTSLISQILPLPESTTKALPASLPENIPLFLLSLLPPQICALPELQAICQLEQCLCEPQADNALAEIRHQHCRDFGSSNGWMLQELGIGPTPKCLIWTNSFMTKWTRLQQSTILPWMH